MMGYFTAPRLAYGPSAIEELSGTGITRALVIVSPSVATTPHVRHALELLERAGAVVEMIDAGPERGRVVGVERLLERARALRPDGVVAIGGGRTLDTAKGLVARLSAPELPLERLTPVSGLPGRSGLRFVALPTTAGSGSEATWSLNLTGDDGAALELTSRELLADAALVDPTFVATLPSPALAASAAGALSRSFEAFVSPWAGPLTDALSVPALASILGGLGRVDRHRDGDLDASLQLAATQAGIAAANAPGGLAHALATGLAAATGRPYGGIVAALLPAVIEFDYPSVRDRFGPLTPVFGSNAGTSRSVVSDRVRRALGAARLPKTLAEAGIPTESLPELSTPLLRRVAKAPGLSGTPRLPTLEELSRLVGAAATGAPVDF